MVPQTAPHSTHPATQRHPPHLVLGILRQLQTLHHIIIRPDLLAVGKHDPDLRARPLVQAHALSILDPMEEPLRDNPRIPLHHNGRPGRPSAGLVPAPTCPGGDLGLFLAEIAVDV